MSVKSTIACKFLRYSLQVQLLINTTEHRANTAVEGRLANFPNAFSIVLPGISNIGTLARSVAEDQSETFNRRFGRWSGSPEGDKGGLFVFDNWLMAH
jgi:hypothetical protein